MNRLDEIVSRRLAFVRLAILAALLATVVGNAAAQPVTVTGTITDSDGNPVSGASVGFFQQPGGSVVIETTNGSGVYVCGVLPGCYRMMVSDPAFGDILYPGTIAFGDEELISVETAITGLDMQIPPGHSIGGTFTATGALPPQINVDVLDENGDPTIVAGLFFTADWNFPYLPEGRYTIVASDATFPGVYSGRWFDGVYSQGEATVINLTADRNDIDFAFQSKPIIQVEVTRPNGTKAAGDQVVSYTRGNEYSPVQAATDASGVASISGADIVPGYQYQVGAFGSAAARFWAFPGPAGTFESFPDSDWFVAIPGLNPLIPIAAGTPGSVAGTVTDLVTGDPVAGAVVRTTDPLPAIRLGANFFSSPATSASGAYTIGGIQKDRFYGLSVTPSSAATNFYLPNTVDFFPVTGAVAGKDITLTRGTRFNVTVTRRIGGTAVAFALVFVYSADCSTILAVGFTTASGIALTPVVPAGNYRIFVQAPFGSDLANNWAGDAAVCANADSNAGAVGVATAVAVALDPASAGGGHTVSGRVTDGATGEGVFATIQFVNTVSGTPIFDFTDLCGSYSAPGVPAGIYNAFLAASGYAPQTFLNAVTVAGSDVERNFTLTAVTGGISGEVTNGGQPVQGAQVCTTTGFCDESDSSGFYRIGSLAAGTYQLICYTYSNQEPEFFNNKSTKATADNVVVASNATTTGRNFDLGDVPNDPSEPDGAGPPILLSRPEKESGPVRLLPQAPQTRSFASTEDTDWFRFAATNGQVYRVTVTGGGFTQYGVFSGVFDGTTHARDAVASVQLFSPSGWTATGTGERWLGISSALSGSYTITLTAGSGGPPTPTVTGINPTSGPNGTDVTITGTNFEPNATVRIGGLLATSVVRVNSTTITCKTPALAAGALYDVVVDNPGSAIVVGGASPHAPEVSGTLAKGWFADFTDVAQSYLYHLAIESLIRAGITTGCGGGRFCPEARVTRDAMAVFILRGKNGGTFLPPVATGNVLEDVTATTFLARWMEQFFTDGITTGCGTSPGATKPNYCPTANVTRDAMSVFLLRGKNGAAFLPPMATGTVFGDVTAATFLALWMEGLKEANITQGCGGGNYCPLGLVSRGEMASFIRRTFGL